jgi:cytochrome P450
VSSAINELLSNEELIERVQSDDGQLRYSQSVFREALRLWPPVFSTSIRQMPADLTLSNGMVLTKECCPMPFIGPMHRSEANFKNPLVFDPSRPTGEGMSLPFSRGSRNCIGSPLALLEGAILINRVMSQLKLTRKREPVFEWMQTWKPKGLLVDCEAL